MNFELHVTVPHAESDALRHYVRASVDDMKAHTFMNVGRGGFQVMDVMSSEKLRGWSTSMARVRLEQRVEHMRGKGLTTLRGKIETEAWSALETPSTDGYFETHVSVLGVRDAPTWDWVWGVRGGPPMLSVSVPGGLHTITLRGHGTRGAHLDDLDAMARCLFMHGAHVVERPHQEFVVHDSNPAHNAAWAEASRCT